MMQRESGMQVVQEFFTPEEAELGREFLANGYVIRDVADRGLLDQLRHAMIELACKHMGRELPRDEQQFMDRIHDEVKPEKLNDLRLAVFRGLNELPWLRPTYHALGRRLLDTLVGNELAMQNRVNLSIQMSNDDSSLLDIHADVYGGETPFQVVQWLPLVDVAQTKSMFILPQPKTLAVNARLRDIADDGMSGLFDKVKKDLVWLNVPYGKVLIFASHCLHGNVINREPTSRWSLNCRFTGLFTPYTGHEKKLGSFYLPITVRPVSRIGMRFEYPGGFEE
jgi:sporadic carbohydrate cluster 2OG-Fe(II) oxygenase